MHLQSRERAKTARVSDLYNQEILEQLWTAVVFCGGGDRGGGGGDGDGGGGSISGAAMAHSSVRRTSKPQMMIVVVTSSSSIFSFCFALSLLAFFASAHILTGNFVCLFYFFVFLITGSGSPSPSVWLLRKHWKKKRNFRISFYEK